MAGASPDTAARLGLAMLALQCSIGSLNDVVDAPHDAGRKPRKPIPRGLVSVGQARLVAAGGLAVGLVLAAASGPIALLIAATGTGMGYLYDLRLQGSPLSWAPYALGIPMLPLFAWVGAGGALPGTFLVLVPLAALAGAGIAIGNARADHERDVAAGTASVSTRLGLQRSWWTHAGILLAVIVGAAAAGALLPGARTWLPAAVGGSAVIVLVGVALGRSPSPGRRELAWEVEAAGIGILAIAWLLGTGETT